MDKKAATNYPIHDVMAERWSPRAFADKAVGSDRINRELDGEIDVDRFHHHAFYNKNAGRIEMHLLSECAQTLRIDGHSYDFAEGESIHTENSYKYSVAGFRALAEQAGFRSEAVWLDDEALFSLHYLNVDS